MIKQTLKNVQFLKNNNTMEHWKYRYDCGYRKWYQHTHGESVEY